MRITWEALNTHTHQFLRDSDVLVWRQRRWPSQSARAEERRPPGCRGLRLPLVVLLLRSSLPLPGPSLSSSLCQLLLRRPSETAFTRVFPVNKHELFHRYWRAVKGSWMKGILHYLLLKIYLAPTKCCNKEFWDCLIWFSAAMSS